MSADVAIAEPHAVEAPSREALADEDLAVLRSAVAALEGSTWAGRLSAMAGRPVELLGHALPGPARDAITGAVESALKGALRVALTTLPRQAAATGSGRSHTLMAAASGALGGALGLATLPVELPVSTTLILRAIASIAREEGEDLDDPAVGLECLAVFALGSRTNADDLAGSGYLAVRSALAKSITDAARLVAGRGLTDRSAPALVRITAQIAARFGVVVSQKVAAGAVPIVGAFGGAAVNAAFMEHFRAVARAHFSVRRLERVYGVEPVRAAYEAIRAGVAATASPPEPPSADPTTISDSNADSSGRSRRRADGRSGRGRSAGAESGNAHNAGPDGNGPGETSSS